MSYFLIALCIFILLFVLYALATRCQRSRAAMRRLRPWAYAHRGLHDAARPENSLSAFRAAVAKGYGIELDVHLMKDGQLAVIHDSALARTTGAAGRIEDLESHDLWQYRLEGSGEHIPSFREVLDLTEGKVPLLIELKVVGNNYASLCQALCRELEGYPGLYAVQSFDPRAVRWFRKHRPDLLRGQLAENFFRAKGISWLLWPVMSWQTLNFWTRPDFISYKYAHRKTLGNKLVRKLWGAAQFTWVVTTPEEYKTARKEGWICIFENFEP